ncbi:MAG: hypothetical protein ACKOHI_08810 [Phycisphaerales bacterium]
MTTTATMTAATTTTSEERRAEAADADTPFARLQELAATNPSTVLQNPAFDLAVVTDPSFLVGMTEDALCALLRQPAFPPDLMVALAQRLGRLKGNGERVATRIALHPNAPREGAHRVHVEPRLRLIDQQFKRLRAAVARGGAPDPGLGRRQPGVASAAHGRFAGAGRVGAPRVHRWRRPLLRAGDRCRRLAHAGEVHARQP